MVRKRATGAAAKTPGSSKKVTSKKAPAVSGPPDMSALAMSLRNSAATDLAKIGATPTNSLIDRVYGIPLERNLPMQYLLGVSVLPMERTLSLVGEKGSLKSVMSWYFCALFLRYKYPGMVFFEDAEFKTNDDQIRGVIQNDILATNFIFPTEVHNVKEMIETMVYYSKKYDEIVPNHDVPICYLVDSIGALTSAAAQAAMEKTGNVGDVAGYDRARTAALITEHFRSWVPLQAGKPMCLIYVNHIKEKIAEAGGPPSRGAPEKVSPGGAHKDYLNTATIEMIKLSTPQVKSEMRAQVIMKTLKASLAETGRKISVMMRTIGPVNARYPEGDILGSLETEDDVQRLYVYFDWDTSLVDLLTSDLFPQQALSDVLGGKSGITGSGNQVGCPRLGISGVSKQELGAALHADPQITKELQDVLGILRKRRYVPPGVTESEPVPASDEQDGGGTEGQECVDSE